MKTALVTLYSCLGLGVPALDALMEIMLSNSTSCQIRGGDDIANLACRNTVCWSWSYAGENRLTQGAVY